MHHFLASISLIMLQTNFNVSKFGLTNLHCRTYPDGGMAGQSHGGRSSARVPDSTVTWNISSPTRCLVSWGRQFCSSLVSPSEQLQETRCRRTDKHVLLPRSRQLPFQNMAFASKIHTHLFFPARLQAFPSPPAKHVLGWKSHALFHLPPLLEMFLSISLDIGPIC